MPTVIPSAVAVLLALSGSPSPSTVQGDHRTPSAGDELNLADFGAVGDGVVDDTAAIQRSFDAAVSSRRGLFIPRPAAKYRITSSLWIRNGRGIVIRGANAWDTTIKYDGPAGGTVLWMYNCYRVKLTGLGLEGSDKVAAGTIINIQGNTSDPSYAFASGSCVFEDLRISGGDAYADYGVRFTIAPGSQDVNNDLSVWRRASIGKTRMAHVSIEHANSKTHAFYDCVFLWGGRQPWSEHPDDTGFGVRVTKGSFRWFGGYFGYFKGANFRIEYPDVDGLAIINANSESSARFLDITAAGAFPHPTIVEGARYSAARLSDPGAASEKDGYVIRSASPGPMLIHGCRWGEGNQTSRPKMLFTSSSAGYVEVVGNAFDSLDSASLEDTIVASPAMQLEMRGNIFKRRDGTRTLAAPRRAGAGRVSSVTGSVRGSIVMTGAGRNAEISLNALAIEQGETDYQVVIGPASAITGHPPEGATRVRSVTKLPKRVVIELEAAPGDGNSVTFDWIVAR